MGKQHQSFTSDRTATRNCRATSLLRRNRCLRKPLRTSPQTPSTTYQERTTFAAYSRVAPAIRSCLGLKAKQCTRRSKEPSKEFLSYNFATRNYKPTNSIGQPMRQTQPAKSERVYLDYAPSPRWKANIVDSSLIAAMPSFSHRHRTTREWLEAKVSDLARCSSLELPELENRFILLLGRNWGERCPPNSL